MKLKKQQKKKSQTTGKKAGRQLYLQSRVCVRIMVGQVADILFVFEVYCKGKSIKRCSFAAPSWTKVISEKYFKDHVNRQIHLIMQCTLYYCVNIFIQCVKVYRGLFFQ